ncbi:MAG: DUF2267 domain-containing protein [Actinomycetota bacterium]
MTRSTLFAPTIDKTNQVLKEIEKAYGWPAARRSQSYLALKAVLHALRDRLTVQEASDLAAQLPMLVRGIYYEGWDPIRVPVKMDREEFLERIRREFTYEVEGGPELLVQRVVQAIRRFVTDGEWDDVRAGLPEDLRDLLGSSPR